MTQIKNLKRIIAKKYFKTKTEVSEWDGEREKRKCKAMRKKKTKT